MNGKRRGVDRLRWWLLPHIGYYADGLDVWRTAPARWLWIALGWVPRIRSVEGAYHGFVLMVGERHFYVLTKGSPWTEHS